MNASLTPGATSPAPGHSAVAAIFWAGLLCGIFDIIAAFVVYGSFGLKPIPLLQGIASGVLGQQSYEGGLVTAFLGLVCHFVIAYGAATVFVAASRLMPFLIEHAVPYGVLYGIAVYFFMNEVVLPLSAIGRRPFSLQFMLIGVGIHIFTVGLTIALTVRHFSAK
jgi:uncharacterized membrane protein YagU involved in acid resistance